MNRRWKGHEYEMVCHPGPELYLLAPLLIAFLGTCGVPPFRIDLGLEMASSLFNQDW